jgi:hypothetical protein
MPQDTCGSVTQIIIGIREGDSGKVAPLWERYFERLTHHAAKYLKFAPNALDEDAALSAINAFCNGLAEGKFTDIDRREKLWGMLAKITERKALRYVRNNRFKREVSFTDLRPDASSAGDGLSRIAIVKPTRSYQEIVQTELEDLINALPNPLWREAARMVMQGYSVPEIAAKLDRGRECVYVWFRTIRTIWEESLGRENLLG